MTTWALLLLICEILQVGRGIPLSDFYPFGSNTNDFMVGPTLDGNILTILDQGFPFFNREYSLVYVSSIYFESL